MYGNEGIKKKRLTTRKLLASSSVLQEKMKINSKYKLSHDPFTGRGVLIIRVDWSEGGKILEQQEAEHSNAR